MNELHILAIAAVLCAFFVEVCDMHKYFEDSCPNVNSERASELLCAGGNLSHRLDLRTVIEQVLQGAYLLKDCASKA